MNQSRLVGLQEVFTHCDFDDDGLIDKEELRQVFKSVGQDVSEEVLNEVMESMDPDGDGKISYADFASHFEAAMKHASTTTPDIDEFESKLRWVFDLFDKDGDGVVAVDDLREILRDIGANSGLHENAVEAFIRKLDEGNQGSMTFPHFLKVTRQMTAPNGDTPHSPRQKGWVAPESIVNMIRKRGESVSEMEASHHLLTIQLEQQKLAVERFKAENEFYYARINKLAAELQTAKESNEKFEAENAEQKEALATSQRIMKQNRNLQNQNRTLENTLEALKSEHVKSKEQLKDLQRALSKVKMERDELNVELHAKRRDLMLAEEKVTELQSSTTPTGFRKSASLSNLAGLDDIMKLQEENQVLKFTLEKETKKVNKLVMLLNEDNTVLKNQVREDSALIESSNQIIKKLRQALEETSSTPHSSDPFYKTSLLSELEQEVAIRLTPRVTELTEEEQRERASGSPFSPPGIGQKTKSTPSLPMLGGVNSPLQSHITPLRSDSPTNSAQSSTRSTPANTSFKEDSLSEQKLKPPLDTEEQEASEELNYLDEIDELEDKLIELQEKYAKLEGKYTKLQQENQQLKEESAQAVRKKLNFDQVPQDDENNRGVPKKLDFEQPKEKDNVSISVPKLDFGRVMDDTQKKPDSENNSATYVSATPVNTSERKPVNTPFNPKKLAFSLSLDKLNKADDPSQQRDDLHNLRKSKFILTKQLEFLNLLQNSFVSKTPTATTEQMVLSNEKELEALLRDPGNPEVEDNRKLQNEIHKWIAEFRSMLAAKETLDATLANHQAQSTSTEAELMSTLQAELTSLRQIIQDGKQTTEQSDTKYVELNSSLGALQVELDRLRQASADDAKSKAQSDAEYAELNSTLGALRVELDRLRLASADDARSKTQSDAEHVAIMDALQRELANQRQTTQDTESAKRTEVTSLQTELESLQQALLAEAASKQAESEAKQGLTQIVQNLRAELESLRQNVTAHNGESGHQQDLTETVANLNAELEMLRRATADQESAKQALAETVEKMRAELEDLRQNGVSQGDSTKQDLAETVALLNTELETLRQAATNQESSKQELTETVEKMRAELEALRQSAASQGGSVEQEQVDMETVKHLNAELETLRRAAADQDNTKQVLNESVEKMRAELEALRQTAASQGDSATETVERLRKELEALRQSAASNSESVKQEQADAETVVRLNAELETLRRDVAVQESAKQALNENVERMRAELEALRQSTASQGDIATETVDKMRAELEALRSAVSQSDSTKHEQTETVAKLRAELEAFRQIAASQGERGTQEQEDSETVTRLRAELSDALLQNAADQEYDATQREELTDTIEKLRKELEALRQNTVTQETGFRHAEITAIITTLSEQVTAQGAHINALLSELNNLRQAADLATHLANKQVESNAKLAALQAEAAQLRQAAQNSAQATAMELAHAHARREAEVAQAHALREAELAQTHAIKEAELSQLRAQRDTAVQAEHTLRQQIEQQAQELKGLRDVDTNWQGNMRKEISDLQHLVDSLKTANEHLQASNQSLLTKHTAEKSQFEDDLESANQHIRILYADNAELEKKLTANESELETANQNVRLLFHEKGEMQERIAYLSEKLAHRATPPPSPRPQPQRTGSRSDLTRSSEGFNRVATPSGSPRLSGKHTDDSPDVKHERAPLMAGDLSVEGDDGIPQPKKSSCCSCIIS